MITLVQGTLASIELLVPGLNFIELPALRFDKGSNGFSGEKRSKLTDLSAPSRGLAGVAVSSDS
jgi:hypothetical protein